MNRPFKADFADLVLVMPDGRIGSAPLSGSPWDVVTSDWGEFVFDRMRGVDFDDTVCCRYARHDADRHRTLLESGGLVVRVAELMFNRGLLRGRLAAFIPEDGSTTPMALRAFADLLDRLRPSEERLARGSSSPRFGRDGKPTVMVSGAIRFDGRGPMTDDEAADHVAEGRGLDDLIAALVSRADALGAVLPKDPLAGLSVPDHLVFAMTSHWTDRSDAKRMVAEDEVPEHIRRPSLSWHENRMPEWTSEFGLPPALTPVEYLVLLAGGDVARAVSWFLHDGERDWPIDTDHDLRQDVAVVALSSGSVSCFASQGRDAPVAARFLAGSIAAGAVGEECPDPEWQAHWTANERLGAMIALSAVSAEDVVNAIGNGFSPPRVASADYIDEDGF